MPAPKPFTPESKTPKLDAVCSQIAKMAEDTGRPEEFLRAFIAVLQLLPKDWRERVNKGEDLMPQAKAAIYQVMKTAPDTAADQSTM